MQRKLISSKQVAEELGVSRWTVYRWVRQKRVPFLKVQGRLRFEETAIAEWLNRRVSAAE
jgi:excisionase family DNA binding protein